MGNELCSSCTEVATRVFCSTVGPSGLHSWPNRWTSVDTMITFGHGCQRRMSRGHHQDHKRGRCSTCESCSTCETCSTCESVLPVRAVLPAIVVLPARAVLPARTDISEAATAKSPPDMSPNDSAIVDDVPSSMGSQMVVPELRRSIRFVRPIIRLDQSLTLMEYDHRFTEILIIIWTPGK